MTTTGDTALRNWTTQWVTANFANGKLGESYKAAIDYGLPDMTPFMLKQTQI